MECTRLIKPLNLFFFRAAKDGLLDVLAAATRKDTNAKDSDSMGFERQGHALTERGHNLIV